jgi:hypothetical protein
MVKLGSFFVTGKRNDGTPFVSLKDERPEWLHDAVHAAHGSDMPNDWIYRECEAACDAIDEGRFNGRYWQDNVSEHADGRVDVYTRKLYQWAADFCLSDTFAEAQSRADEFGSPSDASQEKRIAIIQYCAIERIANVMIEAWREEGERADEEESEASNQA